MKIKFTDQTEVSVWREERCVEEERVVEEGEIVEVTEISHGSSPGDSDILTLPNGTVWDGVYKGFYEVVEDEPT